MPKQVGSYNQLKSPGVQETTELERQLVRENLKTKEMGALRRYSGKFVVKRRSQMPKLMAQDYMKCL